MHLKSKTLLEVHILCRKKVSNIKALGRVQNICYNGYERSPFGTYRNYEKVFSRKTKQKHLRNSMVTAQPIDIKHCKNIVLNLLPKARKTRVNTGIFKKSNREKPNH